MTPDGAVRADTVKMRALVAGALLVTILLVVLQATPPIQRAEPPPPTAPFFEREPEIRVRVATLDVGQDVVVRGVAGQAALTVANGRRDVLVGGEAADVPRVLAAATDGDLVIGDRRYQGDLLVVREPESGRVHLVNRVPIETYLEGVVLSEMPADYPDEALYAQAIASRSYAAWQIVVRKDRLFDVTDTQRSQVYRGVPVRLALARRVVAATKGRVLTSGGQILEGVFSSTCGGTTRSAEEAFGHEAPAPLQGVICGLCEGSTFSTWTARVKRADAGAALGLGGPIEGIGELKSHASGRLMQVVLRGPKGREKSVSGNQFRDLFGGAARSTWITQARTAGDLLIVEGRGFGHGVGMCQVGASRLAAAGRTHTDVIEHYYPGAVLAWLYPVHEG